MVRTPACPSVRFRQCLGWAIMVLSVVQVAALEWWARGEGAPAPPLGMLAHVVLLYGLLSLPGLAAAWLASCRRGRESLVGLGVLYPLGLLLGFFPLVVTGVLWLVAATVFPRALQRS